MNTRYVNDERSERIYAAEIRVRDMNPAAERRFADVTEAARYVDTVQRRTWTWPSATWKCSVSQHNLQTADYRNGCIYLPSLPVLFDMAARELVILHELAHHFAGLHHHHDEMFVAAYLDLVHGMLPSAAELLQTELTREGVLNA